MRMILTIGVSTNCTVFMSFTLWIMLVSLFAGPSLYSSANTEAHSSRSQILWKILHHSQYYQEISKRTDETVDESYSLECCPSETHLIHPRGGVSREGKIVEVYGNYRIVQKFYQTSCGPEVEDRPCRLVDEKVRHLSRCVQNYSYVYAFMKDFNVSENYRLDYMRVKSGCSCQVEFSYPQSIEITSP